MLYIFKFLFDLNVIYQLSVFKYFGRNKLFVSVLFRVVLYCCFIAHSTKTREKKLFYILNLKIRDTAFTVKPIWEQTIIISTFRQGNH